MVIDFWDTAGSERHRAVTNSYIRNSDAVLVVFDVNCQESLSNSALTIENLEQSYNNVEVAKVYLIGNKTDLLNEYPLQYGEVKVKAEAIVNELNSKLKVKTLLRFTSAKS